MIQQSTWQRNHLLAALTSDVKDRLLPYAELVPLAFNKVLYESGSVLRYVYFPTDAIVSMLHVTVSGASAEISVVGNEGLVGAPLVMGADSVHYRAIVLSAGFAYRLAGQKLKDEFNRYGELQRLLMLYTQSQIAQITQMVVCNRYHSVEQQLCRLLLESLDRLPSNQLTMTQELIANRLGVRREGITEAAGKLQKQGVIEYSRGHIAVLNRHKLEQMSCECYGVVKKETDRLLPAAPHQAQFAARAQRGSMLGSAQRGTF